MSRISNQLRHASLLATAMVVLVSAISSAAPQVSPAARVYRSQYKDLRNKATDLLERSRAPRSDKLALQQENLALVKLVHRLQEEADRDSFDRSKPGQSDKSLLLVAQACVALDFMLTSIRNFNDSGDLAFVQLARQAGPLMDATEQYF